MNDISAFGLKARVVATNTFPEGFKIDTFSDDADALDSPDFAVADAATGLNGDLVTWSRPDVIEVAFNVIPTSDDDVNLSVLLNANRVGKGKLGARDIISITTMYPSGMKVTYSKGKIISGALVAGVSNSGRINTRQYRFRFEQINRSNEASGEV